MNKQNPATLIETTLHRLINAVRADPELVEQELDKLLGESADWPTIPRYYAEDDPQVHVDNVADKLGLSRGEFLLLLSVLRVARSG